MPRPLRLPSPECHFEVETAVYSKVRRAVKRESASCNIYVPAYTTQASSGKTPFKSSTHDCCLLASSSCCKAQEPSPVLWADFNSAAHILLCHSCWCLLASGTAFSTDKHTKPHQLLRQDCTASSTLPECPQQPTCHIAVVGVQVIPLQGRSTQQASPVPSFAPCSCHSAALAFQLQFWPFAAVYAEAILHYCNMLMLYHLFVQNVTVSRKTKRVSPVMLQITIGLLISCSVTFSAMAIGNVGLIDTVGPRVQGCIVIGHTCDTTIVRHVWLC